MRSGYRRNEQWTVLKQPAVPLDLKLKLGSSQCKRISILFVNHPLPKVEQHAINDITCINGVYVEFFSSN